MEAGYPVYLGGGWVLEPQAQIAYQALASGSASDAGGLVRFSDVTSFAGRLGGRLARTWALDEGDRPRLMTAWLRANLWQEFLGDPKTEFFSSYGPIPFAADLRGTRAELNGGVTAQTSEMSSLYANASYQIGLDGREHAYAGKIGLRLNW